MKNIVITGFPGIGKTTLVKKIASKLEELKVNVGGFYTEEIRDDNDTRIGFDVVALDKKRGTLARKGQQQQQSCKCQLFKFGPYSVHLEEFEEIALPILEDAKSIVVIDEIGKMELFSKKFENSVKRIIDDDDIKMIVTVPLKNSNEMVNNLKTDPQSKLFTVTKGNRDRLLDEILTFVT